MVGMTSGRWIVLDANTREVYGLHQDGTEPIQVVRLSPNGKLLALGSRDNIIYMYQVSEKYRKFSRLGRCVVSREINQSNTVSSDRGCIVSNSHIYGFGFLENCVYMLLGLRRANLVIG